MERARNRIWTSSLALALSFAAGCGAHTAIDPSGDGDADVADADAADACTGAELCGNGVDDDCDGAIDEGCEPPPGCLCVPGSGRYCEHGGSDTRGTQRCAEGGWEWEACTMAMYAPAHCWPLHSQYSAAFELCLIATGNCAQDVWDLDRDGDEWESVGVCESVACFEPGEELCGDLLDNDGDGHVDVGCGDCDCTPGTGRWCDDPRYSMAGSQICAEDGTWGPCREDALVEACANVEAWYSPAYEACLIAEDECAQDLWDLDFDGDTWESLGSCPDVICPR